MTPAVAYCLSHPGRGPQYSRVVTKQQNMPTDTNAKEFTGTYTPSPASFAGKWRPRARLPPARARSPPPSSSLPVSPLQIAAAAENAVAAVFRGFIQHTKDAGAIHTYIQKRCTAFTHTKKKGKHRLVVAGTSSARPDGFHSSVKPPPAAFLHAYVCMYVGLGVTGCADSDACSRWRCVGSTSRGWCWCCPAGGVKTTRRSNEQNKTAELRTTT